MLEMLARENGMEATVKVLREWVFNKDLDLKERKQSGSGSKDEGGAKGGGGKEKPVGQLCRKVRWLHAVQSIEQDSIRSSRNHILIRVPIRLG